MQFWTTFEMKLKRAVKSLRGVVWPLERTLRRTDLTQSVSLTFLLMDTVSEKSR